MAETNIVELRFIMRDEASVPMANLSRQMGAMAASGTRLTSTASPVAAISDAARNLGGQAPHVSRLAAAFNTLGASSGVLGILGRELALLVGTHLPESLGSIGFQLQGLGREMAVFTGAHLPDLVAGANGTRVATEGAAAALRGLGQVATSSVVWSSTAATALGGFESAAAGASTATVTLGGVLTALAGPAAIAAAAIAAVTVAGSIMAMKTSQAAEHLTNAAAAVGTTPQKLQVLRRVMEDAGFGADSATTALQFMSRAIAEGNTYLKQLNISTHDPMEALLQLSDAFAKSEDINKKNTIALALTGRGFRESVGVIGDFRKRVEETAVEMGVIGETFDDLSLKKLAKLDESLDHSKGAWRALGNQLAVSFAPAAQFIADALLGIGLQMDFFALRSRQGKAEADALAESLGQVRADAVSAAADKTSTFTSTITEAHKETEKLGGALAGIKPPTLGTGDKWLAGIVASAKQAEDALAKVKVGQDKDKDKPDPRETRIQKLVKDSGLLRGVVVELLKVVEAEEKAEAQTKALAELHFLPPSMAAFGAGLREFTDGVDEATLHAESLRGTWNKLGADFQKVAADPAIDALARRIAGAVQGQDFGAMAEAWDQATGQMGVSAEEMSKRVTAQMGRLAGLRVIFDELRSGFKGIADDSSLDEIADQIAEAVRAGDLSGMQSLWTRAIDDMGATATGMLERVRSALRLLAGDIGERFSRAARDLQDEEERSRYLQGLRPLLTRGGLGEEDRAELGRMLQQDDIDSFKAGLDEMTNAYNAFRSAMEAVSQALYSSFGEVFQNMIGTTQTFGQAIHTIIISIVRAALAELSKLIVSGLLKLALKLVSSFFFPTGAFEPLTTFLPTDALGPFYGAIPVAAAGPALGVATQETGRLATASIARGDTFNIYAIDAHSVVSSLTLPRGGMRRAGDTVRIAGAY